jgi:hypothetical protein
MTEHDAAGMGCQMLIFRHGQCRRARRNHDVVGNITVDLGHQKRLDLRVFRAAFLDELNPVQCLGNPVIAGEVIQ